MVALASPSVFISYSSKDRDFALRLGQDLQAHGILVWLDQWNITAGKPYWDQIQAGIVGCSYFLFIISPDSIADGSRARDELAHARHLNKAIVAVIAPGKPVDVNDLPIEVTPGRYHITNFDTLSYAEGFQRVLAAVSKPGGQQLPPVVRRAPNRNRWIVAAAVVGTLVVVGAALLLNSAEGKDNGDKKTTSAVVPSITPLATNVAVLLPVETETEIPTHLPTETNTYTPQPTETSIPTATNTPSPTHGPLADQAKTYPCDAEIVFNSSSLLNIVHAGPSSYSSFKAPIRQGSAIAILEKAVETRTSHWYRIAAASGEELGWIPTQYAVLSDQCPDE